MPKTIRPTSYIRIRITNAGPEADTIHVLPQPGSETPGVGAVATADPRSGTCRGRTDPERWLLNTGVLGSPPGRGIRAERTPDGDLLRERDEQSEDLG